MTITRLASAGARRPWSRPAPRRLLGTTAGPDAAPAQRPGSKQAAAGVAGRAAVAASYLLGRSCPHRRRRRAGIGEHPGHGGHRSPRPAPPNRSRGGGGGCPARPCPPPPAGWAGAPPPPPPPCPRPTPFLSSAPGTWGRRPASPPAGA